MTFHSRIAGIPCTVRIDSIDAAAPQFGADSDWDARGWLDIEMTICDQRGRPAPWLMRKADKDDWNRLEAEALIFIEEEFA